MEKKLRLDNSIYSIEAVEKAAYRFIDRISVLTSQEDGNFLLDITFNTENLTVIQSILDDFKKELLDQNLRLKIKSETEATRTLILSFVFSKTGLQS